MNRREEKKPAAQELKNPGIKKDRQYLCPGSARISFYIPVRDEHGKKVPAKDGRGNLKFSGDVQEFKKKIQFFETMAANIEMTDTFKTMCGYTLKADDPQYEDKLDVLERMRKDPSNMVMDVKMFEKWRNPEASDAILENRRLKAELEERDDLLAKMQAENEEYKKKLQSVK